MVGEDGTREMRGDDLWLRVKASSRPLRGEGGGGGEKVSRRPLRGRDDLWSQVKVSSRPLREADKVDDLRPREKIPLRPLREAGEVVVSRRFCRKDLRRLRRGTQQCERVLDLHGKRWTDGEEALEVFMGESVKRGCRWVMVITGKGTGRMRDMFYSWVERRGTMVLSVHEAPPLRGGEGAFYVALRKRELGE